MSGSLRRFYLVYVKKFEWEDIEFFSDSWKYRIGAMASLIPENVHTVLDVGCGKMWLREFLNKNVLYYGMDYTKRSDDTIICNLNNREFPNMKFDVVFCSGVVEYIHENNLKWFFEKVRETAPVLIVSYNVRDNTPSIHNRTMSFWKNHMYHSEFIKMVEESGFRLDTVEKRDNMTNELFRFFAK